MVKPLGTNDIYEPRTFGKYLFIPAMYNPWVLPIQMKKKFKIGGYVEFYKYNEDKRELRTCQKSIPDIDLMTIFYFHTFKLC